MPAGACASRAAAAGRCARRARPAPCPAARCVGSASVAFQRPSVLHDAALVDQLAEDLLEEERVALGAREDRAARRVAEPVDVEQVRDELASRVLAERAEEDRREVAAPAAPGRARAAQLGPRRAHEEQRPLRSVGELLEQVEQRRVGPVDVVDHDDERLALGEHREQRAPRAVQLDAERRRLEPRELLVAGVEADRERERGGRRSGEIGQQLRGERLDPRDRDLGRVVVGDAGDALQDLGERPVGDALAVGEAAPDQDPRARPAARAARARAGSCPRPARRRS